MAHVVNKNKEGQMAYRGFLTSKEIRNADAMLEALKKEIPAKEDELSKKYKEKSLMCYHLGKYLDRLLKRYDIPPSERRYFWKEINQFATRKQRTRGTSTECPKMVFYEYCYSLSRFDIDVVKRLNYTQWRYVLEKNMGNEERHIVMWLKRRKGKIVTDDWREFSKGLTRFLKTRDMSVFTDDEVMEIYDSVFAMMRYWRMNADRYGKEFPNRKKTNRLRLSRKYIDTCLALKKRLRVPLDEKVFAEAFGRTMG